MPAMAIAIVAVAFPAMSGAVIANAMIPSVVSGIGASTAVRPIGVIAVIAVIGRVRMLIVAVGAHRVSIAIAMVERKEGALRPGRGSSGPGVGRSSAVATHQGMDGSG